VLSQAQVFDPANPTDAQFVENVMWRSRSRFVTLNMPGSNKRRAPVDRAVHQRAGAGHEATERTARTFGGCARRRGGRGHRAQAVLIGLQADMWDPAAIVPGGDGLDGYTAFVRVLADLSVHFGKPVLLINGDPHRYGRISARGSAQRHGLIHNTQSVANLTRITSRAERASRASGCGSPFDPRSPRSSAGRTSSTATTRPVRSRAELPRSSTRNLR